LSLPCHLFLNFRISFPQKLPRSANTGLTDFIVKAGICENFTDYDGE
jgi:hypothetical protein